MEIDRIKIENYRGKSFDFQPGRINLFFRENGSGKTSLCDAIRYGITGLVPKDDVRNTTVQIQYAGGLETERSRGKLTICRAGKEVPGAITGKPEDVLKRVTETALNTSVADAIGVQLEDIRISSSTEVLSSLKPDEFLKLLLKYIPEQLDFDTIIHYFSNLTQEITEECELIFPPMPEQFGIEQIQDAYEYFFKERKELKSMLQMQDSLLKHLTPYEPQRSLADVEAEITGLLVLEKEKSELIQKQKVYEDARLKRQRQDEQVKTLKDRIAGLKKPKKPVEEETAKNEVRRVEAEKKRLRQNSNLATVTNNIDLFERTLSGLSGNTCPISDKLVCTTDKSKIRLEMETLIFDNRKLQNELQEDIKKQTEIIEKCLSAKKEDEANRLAYETMLRYQAELKVYEENLTVVPEAPKQTAPADEFLARKKQLADEKRNYEDYEKKQKLQKETDELNRKIGVYNTILAALADKGEVKSKIVAYYLSMFVDVCNSRAAEFSPGYEFRFISDDGVVVKVKTPANSDFFPLEALSNGERTIATFILMDMLNQLSGARLLFVDNVEALDKERLECLKALLENPDFENAYDHVFICGVNHKSVESIFDGMLATYL